MLLDRYAVRFRYPGETSTRADARRAVQTVTGVRAFARSRLGLS